MSALLALLASSMWGTSDFLGGRLSRSRSTLSVLLGSQLGTLPLALLVFVVGSGWHSDLAAIGWAAAAGLTAMVGLGALYRALAVGRTAVVAPISACGAAAPVAVGLLRGDHFSLAASGGIVCVLIGLVACARPTEDDVAEPARDSGPSASGPRHRRPGRSRAGHRRPDHRWSSRAGSTMHLWRPVLLGLLSAGAFGAVLVFLALAGENSVPMSLLVMRVASLSVLVPAAALTSQLTVRSAVDPVVLAVGLLDLAANGCYALAGRSGEISVVAVLASLYPAVTVLLARQFSGERLGGTRTFGVVATLAGVAFLSTAQFSL